MADSPAPDFHTLDAEKMGAVAAIMPLVMDTLRSYHPDAQVTGDDLLDFFALSIATLFDHDTNIVTPRDERLALETLNSFVKRWKRSLREQRPEGEQSFFAYLLEQDRIERKREAADKASPAN